MRKALETDLSKIIEIYNAAFKKAEKIISSIEGYVSHSLHQLMKKSIND